MKWFAIGMFHYTFKKVIFFDKVSLDILTPFLFLFDRDIIYY